MDLTVAYAKQRVQFGRPIGEYQAVKHRLADAHTGLEFARPLVFAAALSFASSDISAAKAAASEAAYQAARTALQIHGAIGYTDEYDLSVHFKKIRALYSAWGAPAFHRGRLLAAL
ncbi:acyl-CoA dehydrogenase family protein [Catenulispora yoronensis]